MPRSRRTATNTQTFCAQVWSTVNWTHVQLAVTHFGFARGACRFGQGVTILGKFFCLVVLQSNALGHFATRTTFFRFQPKLGITRAATLICSFCAYKSIFINRAAIEVAIAFLFRTWWAMETYIRVVILLFGRLFGRGS